MISLTEQENNLFQLLLKVLEVSHRQDTTIFYVLLVDGYEINFFKENPVIWILH